MDHPSIMRIYEFTSDENYYYIVGEFIDGGELFDEIMRRRYLKESDAAYVARQLLSAITYCHSKAVVHRDLKPENILVESIQESGRINIKIIDFGTALFVSPQVKMKETLGTPYYIAPEVLFGSYTERCDVWSVGIILFFMLSGTVPFNGPTDDDIMNAVRKGKYTFKSKVWESISNDAKDLIKKMLTFNQHERISAAEAYKHPWLTNKDFNTIGPEAIEMISKNMGKFCVILYINLIK